MLQSLSALQTNGTQKAETSNKVSLLSSLLQLVNLKKNECGVNNYQKAEECYNRCVKVFERYPNDIYDLGGNLLESFKSYIDVSIIWNKSNSTIMSTRSTNLLDTIGLLSNLGVSSSYSLSVHKNANPKLFVSYRQIATNLSGYINQSISTIIDVLTDLEQSFDDIFKQFQRRGCECNGGNKLHFQRIMKSGQLLANKIKPIAETALADNKCTSNTYEAIAILVSIVFDNFLNIQGAIISMAAVLESESVKISDFHHSCLLSLDPFIRGIASSMNSESADIAKGVRDLITSFVKQTCLLNNELDTLLAPSRVVVITRNS